MTLGNWDKLWIKVFNFSEGGSYGTSILGNIRSGEFQLPRGISNIFNKSGPGTGTGNNSLRNSFRRKKEKEVKLLLDFKCWLLSVAKNWTLKSFSFGQKWLFKKFNKFLSIFVLLTLPLKSSRLSPFSGFFDQSYITNYECVFA